MHIAVPIVIVGGALLLLLRLCRHYVLRPSPLANLPGPQSSSFFLGHYSEFIKRDALDFFRRLTETYGSTFIVMGIFGAPLLCISDTKALHHVLVKDVELFPRNLAKLEDMGFLLGPGLLSTYGGKHRRQRKMLNPVFSMAHLRNMSPIFFSIARRLQDAMASRIVNQEVELDVNTWMARTTLEMLGQAGLGYSFDDFTEDSTDAFGESLKMFFPLVNSTPLLSVVVAFASGYFSEQAIRRLLRIISGTPNIQRLLDISETMARRSQEIIDEKKAALAKGDEELIHRVGEGKDIMSILLKANTAALEAEQLTDEELVAQMSTFILAGMDTTSNALSRILHLLALHHDVQDKLRAELLEAFEGVQSGADIDYDDLVKLPYLDAVCRETLRLHPPVPMLARQAAEDTVLPLSTPIRARDGSILDEVIVPWRQFVLLNLRASNCNKELWGEDSMEWKPERWLGGLPKEVEDARIPGVYSNLMSFSGGSHSCIGFKFSQLEMKVVLAVLLTSFKFDVTSQPISWNTAPVIYPSMGESTKPEMILKVAAV